MAWRSGLAVVALVAAVGDARAEPNAPDASTARIPSSVEEVRMAAGGSLVSGSQIEGHGSRRPYLEAAGELDLSAQRFFAPRVGMNFDLTFGPTASKLSTDRQFFARFDLALLAAPLRREGVGGGSLVLGFGAGISGGDRYWWGPLRGYPYFVAKGRWLASRELTFHAAYTFSPVDTAAAKELWAMEHRGELAVGVGLLQTGVRVAVTSVRGGDPYRTYDGAEVGVFIGIGVY
ncbi:MAG TPA: hypothetical protein VF316_21175 [Polyangiaceae bacterium]